MTAGEQTVWGLGPKLSPDRRQVAVNVGDLRFGWAGVEESSLYNEPRWQ